VKHNIPLTHLTLVKHKQESDKMPLIRKIVPCGKTSKGIILPKSWLIFYERQSGHHIKEVSIEVNGKLTIRPIFNLSEAETAEKNQALKKVGE
jgi:hypothetical protein